MRISPEERQAECAERCLEVLCDPERAPAARLGEPEEAAIEAARRRWEHAPPGVAAPSSVVADERDEADLLEQLALEAGRRAARERQALQRLGDRRDEAPAGRELGLELGERVDAAGRRHVDRVERRALGQPARAVADDQRHVVHAGGGEVARRAAREARVALDRPHVPARRASTAAW